MKKLWQFLVNPGLVSKPHHAKTHWLGLHGSEYLFTLCLKGVDDPLGDDAIWDKQYGGQAGIHADIKGKSQTTCLHDALRDHPRITVKPDANDPARLENDPRTFSDVLIRIPVKRWNNEDKQGGFQIQRMVSRLTYNHQRDFDNLLHPDRGAHYCVMPDNTLADDEVICQFGLSVYIPSPDDEPHSELSLRTAGKGYSFPSWIFFEEGKRRTRPFGLYPRQAYLQLGYEREHTCIIPPVWFQHKQGFLQLRLLEDTRQQFADDEFTISSSQPAYGHGGRIVCHYHAVDTPEDQLALEIIPHSSIADRIREKGGDAGAVLSGLTIGPSRRRTPSGEHFRLLLVGLVLPRPDVTNPIAGWQLHFDQQGKLLNTPEAQQGYGLQLGAQTQQEGVWWQRSDMATPELLHPPLELDCQNIHFKFYPAPVAAEHYALLALPSVAAFPLDDQPCTLGRPDGNTATPQGRHISLDLLDKTGTLYDAQGHALERSINYLGFSAQHIGLQMCNGLLQVRQLSYSSPTYVLDKNGKLRDTLDIDNEITLQIGEQLLVGSYWLHFDKQTYA